MAASSTTGRPGRASAWWLLALIPIFVLGQRHVLWGADEPREAEIAREMYVSGDWVVPRLNGQPFLEKPPLAHWGAVAVFQILGGSSEQWCRLPSLVWAMLGTVACAWLGGMLFGRRVGLLSAIVLATSLEWMTHAHSLLVDMPLAAGVACTLALFWYGHTCAGVGRRRIAYALSAMAAGIGFLSKGPIGLVLPAVGVLVFLVWRRDWRDVSRLPAPANVAVFAAVVLPWLVLLRLRGGEVAFHTVFWDNMVLRFASSSADHAAPPWYYAIAIFAVMAPWSLFAPPVAYALARPGELEDAKRRRSWQFLVSIIVGPLVLLSVASAKRQGYLLPVTPALAVATAAWLDSALQRTEPPWVRIWRAAGTWVLALFAVAAWGVSGYLALKGGAGLPWSLVGLVVAVAGSLMLGRRAQVDKLRRGPVLVAGLVLVASLSVFSPSTFRTLETRRGYGTLTTALSRVAVPGTRLYGYGMGERELGVVCFERGALVPQVSGPEELRMVLWDTGNVVLVSKEVIEQLREKRAWPEDAEVLAEPRMRRRPFVLIRGTAAHTPH